MGSDSVRNLNPLTSIRFLTAASVVSVHIAVQFYPARHINWLRWENLVSVFFVLSGFILSYVHPFRWQHQNLRFLAARVMRLWPAHVTAIGLIWLAAPAQIAKKFTIGKLVATLTLTHAWFPYPDYWFSFVPPAWTTSTEFGFYLLFPLLIYKLDRTWPWKLFGSFLLLCAAMTTLEIGRDRLVPWTHGPAWRLWLLFHPLPRLFEFVLGMSTFELWRRFGSKLRTGLVAGTFWECVAVASVICTLWGAPILAAHVAKSRFFCSDLISYWLVGGSACFGSAILIFFLALEQGVVARLFSYSFAVLLGELSYAIYLVHYPVLIYCSGRRNQFAAIPDWVIFCLIGILTLAIAYLVWALVERPCRHLLTKLWPTPATTTVVELPASMISPQGVPVRPMHSQVILPSRQGVLIASSVLIAVSIFAALYPRI